MEIFYELTVEGRWNLTLVREKSGLSESNDDWIPEGLLGGSSDHMFVRTRTRTQFLASSLFLAAAVLSHCQLSTPENNYFIIKINFRERERQTDRQTDIPLLAGNCSHFAAQLPAQWFQVRRIYISVSLEALGP